jgi:hypothetical protein
VTTSRPLTKPGGNTVARRDPPGNRGHFTPVRLVADSVAAVVNRLGVSTPSGFAVLALYRGVRPRARLDP